MDKLIEDLQQQIAFSQTRVDGENYNDEWNAEYTAGFIDGLKQAVATIKCDHK